jgi:hypothetical protein
MRQNAKMTLNYGSKLGKEYTILCKINHANAPKIQEHFIEYFHPFLNGDLP